MLGPVELRDAKIWMEVSPEVKSVSLQYYKATEPTKSKTILYYFSFGFDYVYVSMIISI